MHVTNRSFSGISTVTISCPNDSWKNKPNTILRMQACLVRRPSSHIHETCLLLPSFSPVRPRTVTQSTVMDQPELMPRSSSINALFFEALMRALRIHTRYDQSDDGRLSNHHLLQTGSSLYELRAFLPGYLISYGSKTYLALYVRARFLPTFHNNHSVR